jgi:hypothetical protein
MTMTPSDKPAALTAVPCYVSGKGMHATQTTWTFKTLVIAALEAGGLGYDTRYRYYRGRFPGMGADELARLVCDPIEYYDEDWPGYLAARGDGADETLAATEFMLEKDRLFRAEARVAVYCYDEAGFGSGVNSLRFLQEGKPILGFYGADRRDGTLNPSNILQLALEYPELCTLHRYRQPAEIAPALTAWLRAQRGRLSP